ncbi:MAG: hypothetical protein CL573_03175 [Alphaproteobacteria bacterium]|nr:hypothetical protein [Alphaproteobacteria bacterium]HCP01587.1 hypothetical protein [Rhodospirillaceae bacterium]
MRVSLFAGVGAILVAAVFISSQPTSAEIIDNQANALILANRAAAQLSSRDNSTSNKEQQRRALQGSALGTLGSEASCGGIALGNVRPVTGDHRQHETTVIVQGNIINSNNSC